MDPLRSSFQFTVCHLSSRSRTPLIATALERLALLKQDASQIGINARQTVEFLDRITEGKDGLPVNAISLQGPAEQYQKWSDVERHIIAEENEQQTNKTVSALTAASSENVPPGGGEGPQVPGATNVLSQILLSKLNFAKEADITPPTSPSSSNERSTRSSPEMAAAKPLQENVIVPHSLQPLVNAVVWQANNAENANANKPALELYFVSNSADATSLMRSFGVITKNVHQLRQAIGLEDQELKNQSKYLKKHPSPPPSALEIQDAEPKGMFKYEDDSDEEQVVFKPRGRGSGDLTTKSASSSPVMRGSPLAVARPSSSRPSSSHHNSPRMAHNHPNRAEQVKPEVPTEEIDPNSFDRGSFGRANGQRLVLSDGNIPTGFQHRAPFHRGGFAPSAPSRGFYRGSPRGVDRGSLRGRGRLFVP